jgi:hypothetical protein
MMMRAILKLFHSGYYKFSGWLNLLKEFTEALGGAFER